MEPFTQFVVGGAIGLVLVRSYEGIKNHLEARKKRIEDARCSHANRMSFAILRERGEAMFRSKGHEDHDVWQDPVTNSWRCWTCGAMMGCEQVRLTDDELAAIRHEARRMAEQRESCL